MLFSKKSSKLRKITSTFMAAAMTLSIMPTIPMTASAAQSDLFVDPATQWIDSGGAINDLERNAVVTQETQYCNVCEDDRIMTIWRVPEYTASGETLAKNGSVSSDGHLLTTGEAIGTGDLSVPKESGGRGIYTGWHWTKSYCSKCCLFNTGDDPNVYSHKKNVFSLNVCKSRSNVPESMTKTYYQLKEGEYVNNVPYDPEEYHRVTTKPGDYCQFCYGTYYDDEYDSAEVHNGTLTVDPQIGNHRFLIHVGCDDCGYDDNFSIVSWAYVTGYTGVVDGKDHTVEVHREFLTNNVEATVYYQDGTTGEYTTTNPPTFDEAGTYNVNYKMTYKYTSHFCGKTLESKMDEYGTSQVVLYDQLETSSTIIIDGSTDDTTTITDAYGNIIVIPVSHSHDYEYRWTVAPTCTDLGYEVWQCEGCGAVEKRNYTPAKGHNYEKTVVSEATCTQTGLILYICDNCGDTYAEETPINPNNHVALEDGVEDPAATCEKGGKIYDVCRACGYKILTDVTEPLGHDWEEIVTINPTCLEQGYTEYQCKNCHQLKIEDYTDPTGHSWSETGTVVSEASCAADGLIEYTCDNCGVKQYKAISATGHTPGDEETCTEPQVCTVCGAILELPTGHHYDAEVVPPTCTSMGYTIYTCEEGDDSYIADYTDKLEHDYNAVVTSPTCTSLGYTTYTCKACGDTYKDDYIDKLPHNYDAVVTPPTCTSMGYTTYTCKVCGDSYVGDYTDVLPHNYTKKVIEPTCYDNGYTIYTCPDCGAEYIGDYVDTLQHNFTSVVTDPTCTSMGYTTFTCDECGYEYVSDYTDKLPHDYKKEVIDPTCTEHGYTTYTCSICGDSYNSDYVDATGHSESDWIVDEPATYTSDGSKHKECSVCGEVLETASIPMLTEQGNTDEEGEQTVGHYVVLLTDKDGKAIFNSHISISEDDVVTIELPEDRILSASDKTTVTVVTSDTNEAVEGLRIIVLDKNDNAATGTTDEAGQVTFPNSTSDAEKNDVVTDDENTYVVLVQDKYGNLIPNCGVKVGDNYSIDIILPEGTPMDSDNRITVTVVNEDSEPYADIRIIVIGDDDHIESGYTNVNGQVTLPITNQGYTNYNGVANVNGYIVRVTNESDGAIAGALVTVENDELVLVALPQGKSIDYHNRTTVTVITTDGVPVEDISVNVYDFDGNDRTEKTDENGQVVVPPLNEDIVDVPTHAPVETGTPKPFPATEAPTLDPDATEDPNATEVPNITEVTTTAPTTAPTTVPADSVAPTVTADPDMPDVTAHPIVPDGSYNVSVRDNGGPIDGAIVIVDKENGTVTVKLPDGKTFDPDNRVVVTVTDGETNEPVIGAPVTVETKNGEKLTDITNEKGQAIVPPISSDLTDINGDATVVEGENIYNVHVKNENDGPIQNAAVKVEDSKISVILPDGKVIDYKNRTTVTVTDGDSEPISDIEVTVSDNTGAERTQNTDEQGAIVVPPLNEDKTVVDADKTENPEATDTPAHVVVPTATPDPDATEAPTLDPDATEDPNATPVPTERPHYADYDVTVEDENGTIDGAVVVADEDGNLVVTLPDGSVVDDYDNRITVTVTSDGTPVEGIDVTVRDNTGAERTEATDENGQIVVPPLNEDKSDENGKGEVENGDNRYNVEIKDENGPIDDATIKVDDEGNVSVALPDDVTLDPTNKIEITVTDKDGNPVKDVEVDVVDKDGNTADDTTNSNGVAIVPSSNEDYTDSNGYGYVVDTDDEGNKTGYNVVVSDTTGKIENAHVVVENGKISVTLPDGKTLTTSNQTTVTVTDKDGLPVQGLSVTVYDATTSKTASTNTLGQITVPVKTTSGGGGGGGSSSGGSSSSSTQSYLITVTDKDGKTVTTTKSVKDGVYTLTLPTGYTLDDDNYYTVTVTDSKKTPKQGVEIVLKDKSGTQATGTTNIDGQCIIPAVKHAAYIEGYDDGSVRPDGTMTRAEAATIFARNVAERMDERIPSATSSKFTDVSAKAWYNDYINYLAKYKVIDGYDNGTFDPDGTVSRAEFVTMCTRFYELFDEITESKKNSFSDVATGHWAYSNINEAVALGWISGYNDGSFKPDNNITRAEAVTVANAVLGRSADDSYISKNKTTVNPFTDLTSTSYWAYEDILEAANTHMTKYDGNNNETWVDVID